MTDGNWPAPWLRGEFKRHRSGVCTLMLFPQALDDVLDLLVASAGQGLIVAAMSYADWDRNPRAERSLAGLARTRKVAHYATADGEGIIIAPKDLGALVNGLWHWNFHCWDCASPPSSLVLAKQSAALDRIAVSYDARPVLHWLSGARLFVDSHDDDDLHIESRGMVLLHAVFGRAVERLVARELSNRTERLARFTQVSSLPSDIVEYFLAEVPQFSFSIRERQAKPQRIHLDFGQSSSATTPYRQMGQLDYDARTGFWRRRFGADM